MLRNPELRRFAILLVGLSIAAVLGGLWISPAAGGFALLVSAVFVLTFFAFTGQRYRRLAALSARIDQVLHNEEDIFPSEEEEGELAILQSEIKKMTLRIRTQNEALRREKTHLADSLADIAHQLRTPLTSANLALTLLAGTESPEERKERLRDAKRSFVQMDWLLTSLLKLSRLDAGIVEFRREPVPVEALFSAALAPLLIPLELRQITVTTTVPEGAVLLGDLPWLSEALQNVLKNCMEQAGEGGEIVLSCEDTLLYTKLAIRDSGPGFSPEDLPRLFERFYRGKSSSTAGFGIGLALCRTIITRQGGSIQAKNHPKGGAVFVIRFPK